MPFRPSFYVRAVGAMPPPSSGRDSTYQPIRVSRSIFSLDIETSYRVLFIARALSARSIGRAEVTVGMLTAIRDGGVTTLTPQSIWIMRGRQLKWAINRRRIQPLVAHAGRFSIAGEKSPENNVALSTRRRRNLWCSFPRRQSPSRKDTTGRRWLAG